jgi:hypothetical protein
LRGRGIVEPSRHRKAIEALISSKRIGEFVVVEFFDSGIEIPDSAQIRP